MGGGLAMIATARGGSTQAVRRMRGMDLERKEAKRLSRRLTWTACGGGGSGGLVMAGVVG